MCTSHWLELICDGEPHHDVVVIKAVRNELKVDTGVELPQHADSNCEFFGPTADAVTEGVFADLRQRVGLIYVLIELFLRFKLRAGTIWTRPHSDYLLSP